MAAGLGDEGSEVQHHIFTDKILGTLGIRRFACEVLARHFKQLGIQVLSSMFEAGEPCEVIDSRALPFHLVACDSCALREKVPRTLHGVTKPDDLHV